MFFVLLLLFFVPNIICHKDYQTIPLRYDAAINHIKRYQHTNFNNLLDDILTDSIISSNISSYTSFISKNNTNQCEEDFKIILDGIVNRDTWALKIFDAWGKPLPSGILKGNLHWVGNYDECLHPIYDPTNKTFLSQPFNTQYCSLYSDSSDSQQIFNSGNLVVGICLPSSCNKQEIVSLIHTVFKKSNITEDNFVCSSDPPNGQKNFTHGAIATIIILSLLALLVFTGTIIDLILMLKVNSSDHLTPLINGYTNHLEINQPERLSQYSDTKPYMKFFAEFSAIKTLRRIFTMKQKKDDNTFLFINGIRVLSLFWVIIGHSLLFGLIFSSNVLDVITWTRNISLQLLLSGTLSVDTFFVLSGFLTAILFIRQVEKEEKLSFRLMILYYIHRYIRLTPTFLLIILVSINLTPYFGSGPLYPTKEGFEVPQCRREYWWTSILYVGNIVKSDYVCLPVSWYLYNDMQFHWIAPLCLIPFGIKRKPIAFIITILFILVGIGSIAGLLIYYPNLQSSAGLLAPPEAGRTFFNTIYVTPWCRISPYFIGVLTGFIVINTGRSYHINKYILIFCSIISILIALLCLFAMYPDSILVPGIDRISFIIYQSLSRTFWSFSIGWLLFLCSTNRCKIINKILSWPIWAPLARLNYSTYLIHLTVLFIMITNQRMPFYFQPHLVINNFISHIFFSYITAIIVVIFFETPFFIIEKKLFKR